jgi:hypothetical protein
MDAELNLSTALERPTGLARRTTDEPAVAAQTAIAIPRTPVITQEERNGTFEREKAFWQQFFNAIEPAIFKQLCKYAQQLQAFEGGVQEWVYPDGTKVALAIKRTT